MWEELKTIRIIAVFVFTFCICFGLFACKSPEDPEIHEYRARVEVIYTRVLLLYTEHGYGPEKVMLTFDLYDPEHKKRTLADSYGQQTQMTKIGENKYRAYLNNVFIQSPGFTRKHRIWVADYGTKDVLANREIEIQGAYALEHNDGSGIPTMHFSMSAE